MIMEDVGIKKPTQREKRAYDRAPRIPTSKAQAEKKKSGKEGPLFFAPNSWPSVNLTRD